MIHPQQQYDLIRNQNELYCLRKECAFMKLVHNIEQASNSGLYSIKGRGAWSTRTNKGQPPIQAGSKNEEKKQQLITVNSWCLLYQAPVCNCNVTTVV